MGRVKQFSAALVAAVLALAAAVVGILALTVWKPAQEVVASVTPTEPYVMTHAKMLPLIAKDVTVTASAPDNQSISLVLGTTGDVTGWIGDSGYDEVVGVEPGMTTLKTTDHEASTASAGPRSSDSPQSGSSSAQPQSGASPSASASASASEGAQSGQSQSGDSTTTGQTSGLVPSGNDMWLSDVTGTGSVTMDLTNVPDGRSILAATDGTSAAPTLTLTWAVHRANVGAVVAFSLCALFVLMAIVLFVWRLRVVRHRSRRARHLAERATADSTDTQQIPVVGEDDQDTESDGEDTGESPVEEGSGDTEETDSTGRAEAKPEEPQTHEPAPEDSTPESDSAQHHDTAEDGSPEEDSSEEASATTGRHGRPGAPLEVDPPETVPTDSGLIDVSAIREGVAFPSRRALREARARGEDHIVIDGHEFDTGLIPTVSRENEASSGASESQQDPSESEKSADSPEDSGKDAVDAEASVLDSRTIERGSWSSLMSGWIRGGKSKGGDDATQS